VLDWLRQSACPKKYSVQFVSITGKVSQPFYFFKTIPHECSQTWQIWRGEFDQMLLDNAAKKGVEVRHHVSVRDVLMEGSRGRRRRADTKDGAKGEEIRAKVVIDATGRDSLLSRKFGWKDRDADLNKIAVWTYFEGAKRDPGLDEGATTVAYIPQKGWFWYIPMAGNIGQCRRRRRSRAICTVTRAIQKRSFSARLRRAPGFRSGSESASRSKPVRVTGEYSYHSKKIGGDGFCLAATPLRFSIRCSRRASSWRSRAAKWPPTPSTRRSRPVTARLSRALRRVLREPAPRGHELPSPGVRLLRLSFSFREFLQVYPTSTRSSSTRSSATCSRT
jgi:hypothetical protein